MTTLVHTTSKSTPRYGGTLRYFGPGGMDHLDPSCAYYALSHQIIRLFARQLFGYPTRVDHAGLIPAPDVAVTTSATASTTGTPPPASATA